MWDLILNIKVFIYNDWENNVIIYVKTNELALLTSQRGKVSRESARNN